MPRKPPSGEGVERRGWEPEERDALRMLAFEYGLIPKVPKGVQRDETRERQAVHIFQQMHPWAQVSKHATQLAMHKKIRDEYTGHDKIGRNKSWLTVHAKNIFAYNKEEQARRAEVRVRVVEAAQQLGVVLQPIHGYRGLHQAAVATMVSNAAMTATTSTLTAPPPPVTLYQAPPATAPTVSLQQTPTKKDTSTLNLPSHSVSTGRITRSTYKLSLIDTPSSSEPGSRSEQNRISSRDINSRKRPRATLNSNLSTLSPSPGETNPRVLRAQRYGNPSKLPFMPPRYEGVQIPAGQQPPSTPRGRIVRGARTDVPSSSTAMPPPRPGQYYYPGHGDVFNGLHPSQPRLFDYSQLGSPSGRPDHGPREFPPSSSNATLFNPYPTAPTAYTFGNLSQNQQHDAVSDNPTRIEQPPVGISDFPHPQPSEDPSKSVNASANGKGKKRKGNDQAEDTTIPSVNGVFGSAAHYFPITEHGFGPDGTSSNTRSTYHNFDQPRYPSEPLQSPRVRVPLPGPSSDVTTQDGPVAGPSALGTQGDDSGGCDQMNGHTGPLVRHDSIFHGEDAFQEEVEDIDQANEHFLKEWMEFS